MDPGHVVQLVRMPACHAGGRVFESRRDRQYFNTPQYKRTDIGQIEIEGIAVNNIDVYVNLH